MDHDPRDPTLRSRLIQAAARIARKHDRPPTRPLRALRKLFVQEVREAATSGAPRVGWKRGEVFEWLLARTPPERAEEWGDIGYYLAQTWEWLWQLYVRITPVAVIQNAVAKFEERALR